MQRKQSPSGTSHSHHPGTTLRQPHPLSKVDALRLQTCFCMETFGPTHLLAITIPGGDAPIEIRLELHEPCPGDRGSTAHHFTSQEAVITTCITLA